MRAWAMTTAIAILIVPVLVVAIRWSVSPGWIFAMVFFLGAPVWIMSYGFSVWTATAMFSPRSAYSATAVNTRMFLVGTQWVFLCGLVFFCLFMSDGGDAEDWQSPAGLILGVEGYNSATPGYLMTAQDLAFPALGLALVAQVVGAVVLVVVTVAHRGVARPVPPSRMR